MIVFRQQVRGDSANACASDRNAEKCERRNDESDTGNEVNGGIARRERKKERRSRQGRLHSPL